MLRDSLIPTNQSTQLFHPKSYLEIEYILSVYRGIDQSNTDVICSGKKHLNSLQVIPLTFYHIYFLKLNHNNHEMKTANMFNMYVL